MFFSLPLYNFLQGWLISAIIVTGIATVVSYHQDRAVRFDDKRWITTPHVRAHVSILAAILALLLAWGYWLKRYELLYSFRKEAFFWRGLYRSQYSDLGLLSDAFGGWLFSRDCSFTTRGLRTWKIPGFGAAGYLGALVVVSWFIPIIFELVVVRPNEFDREKPYIQHAIHYTRKAYRLGQNRRGAFSRRIRSHCG